MKKIALLLIIAIFTLTSCNKEEKEVSTDIENKKEIVVVDMGNEEKLENSTGRVEEEITNTGTIETLETNTGSENLVEKDNSISNKANEKINISENNGMLEYTDSEHGFSILYPKEAYTIQKCKEGDKDPNIELVPVKVFKNGDMFKISYLKQLKDCNLIDIKKYQDLEKYGSLYFKVVYADNKEEFAKKINKPFCQILKSEPWSTSNEILEKIEIGFTNTDGVCSGLDEKEKNCVYSIWDCEGGTHNLYSYKYKKGVVFYGSRADYFLQKYKTYKETMDKGSYDYDVLKSFKFLK